MRGMRWGLAGALLRELHLHRYAVRAGNVRARNSLDHGTGEYVLRPSWQRLLAVIVTTRADGEIRVSLYGFLLRVQVAAFNGLHLIIEGSRWLVSSIRSDPHDPLLRRLFVACTGPRVQDDGLRVNFPRVLKNVDKQTSRPL
jgi:hypothetical protein